MEHLESLARLEERIQKAAEIIATLRQDNKRLEQEASQLLESQRNLERRADEMSAEKQELVNEGRLLREREKEWARYERDRDEIRTRIDSMLAKFEELEI
ncbi:MAG TPA: cell division protein ZapB [Candidatus Krumholzibacteria bacterium]|nr:cell division protein ZapB [Candidatus Krumholzibacteria bacterium]